MSPVSSIRSRSYRRARAAASVSPALRLVTPRMLLGASPLARDEPGEAHGVAGAALDRKGRDRLEGAAVREHGRRLGPVIRWRDLDDVHSGQLDAADDPANGPEQLAREHPTRLG